MITVSVDDHGKAAVTYTASDYKGVILFKKECNGLVRGTLVVRKIVDNVEVRSGKEIETGKISYVDSKKDLILTANNSVYKLDFGSDTKFRRNFYENLEDYKVAVIKKPKK